MDGRCKWCGKHLDTTGPSCPECGGSMIYISASWTYLPDGTVIEDPGWCGPAKFLPERYKAKSKGA